MFKKYTSIFIIVIFLLSALQAPVLANEIEGEISEIENPQITDVIDSSAINSSTGEISQSRPQEIDSVKNLEFTPLANSLMSSGGGMDTEPEPQQEIKPVGSADPKSFLKSFQGKHEVSLFSGALNYYYPLWAPAGRNGLTPNIGLTYSSMDSRYGGLVGYGWSFPKSAIYRTPNKGVDATYSSNEFTAEIYGSAEELVLVDSGKQIYAPKNERSFTQ